MENKNELIKENNSNQIIDLNQAIENNTT